LSSFLKPTALNKVHFPFSLALDRVSSQEIWQFMHNSQLLTVRLFFDNDLHGEFDSLDLIPTDRIQYHRSCNKSYTSKIHLEKIEPVEAQMNASACGPVRTSESICVKTRSMTAPDRTFQARKT
jgi:hypothetical protein